MDFKIKKFFNQMNLNMPISDRDFDNIQLNLKIKFPKEYVDFMKEYNGGEGQIGKSYLAIWPIDQIAQLNDAYAVKEFTPSLVYFGSDGAEIAYAFNYNSENISIVEFPFESIDIKDAKYCGSTFIEFLNYLHDHD